MGIHSPFGYVGYEGQMADLIVNILDTLCACCHTNNDYHKGCHACPAGALLYECRDYILGAMEDDEHHRQYTTEEWAQQREQHGHPRPTLAAIQDDLALVENYKPECDILREMKKWVKRLTPHPFFYVKHQRPTNLALFAELTTTYKALKAERLRKWQVKYEARKDG